MRDGRHRLLIGGMIAPAYGWLAFTVFLPLAVMLYFSFLTEAPFGGREPAATLAHYAAFFERPFYRFLTWRSLKLGLHVVLGCVLVGYPAALVLARWVPGRWREALALLVMLPFWSNSLVRVYSWTMVLQAGGLVDRAVRAFFPDAPPVELLFTYPAVVIGLIHSYLPYMVLTLYVSLQSIDESLLEAARSLGAGSFTTFRRIVFPLSLPGLVAGVVLVYIPVIGSFMEPRLLGGRAGTFIGTVIEDQFVQVFNWPFGAALSFVLLFIVLAIALAFAPLLRRMAAG